MKKDNLSRTQTMLILSALMASLFLSALDSTVVGTAMKTIVNDLHGMQYFAWPFTIYMLCSTIIIPISGGIADIYGRKPIFLIGIIIFIVGSLFCGMSQSMMQLILFRGVQGIGGGVLSTCVFTIVADLFPPQLRGKYIGIVTSVYALSSILGPLLGGLITDYLDWNWIFFINVPIGIIALVLVVLFMPNFKDEGEKMDVDYPGALFIILALVPMLLAFSYAGNNNSWGSVQVIGMLAFSVVMFVIFVIIESRSKNPMIPMSFFKDRGIWVALIVAFLSTAIMFAAIMYIPYFIQGVLGTSATTSGAVTLPMTIGIMITSNLVGLFAKNKGLSSYRLLTITSFIMMVVGCGLLSTMNAGIPYVNVVIFMVVLGLGIGIVMPLTTTNCQNAAPVEQLGSVTGVNMFFRSIGSTIGSAIFGTIMTSSMNSGFSRLDLSNVPSDIQESLKNPQVITDSGTISQLLKQVPADNLSYVTEAVSRAKDVLSSAVHDVFIFCMIVAIAGIVISFFFKDAPMRIRHKSETGEKGHDANALNQAQEAE